MKCPFSLKDVSWLLMFLLPNIAAGGFNNHPSSVSVHENHDAELALWSISATCTVDYTCGYSCSYSCGILNLGTCYTTCYMTCTTTVGCDSCSVTSNPSNLFFENDRKIYKKACTSAGCGPTCNGQGCVNAGETYNVGVRCLATGYNTNGRIDTTLTVIITQNAAPTFNFQSGSSINVYKSSASTGTVVNRMIATDSDSSVDGGSIYYRQSSGPRASWIHGNTLFALNTANGEIYVTRSLASEFSYTFTMTVCVYDRRADETCQILSITLHACYQTPNCTDQTNMNVWDTHGLFSGHGTTNTIFIVTSPDPTNHFPSFFSPGWQALQWTFDRNDLTESTINYNTGEIYLTTNISIHPAWPSKDFTQIVRVGNSESCYTTTCTMFIRVWYTNWPVEIRSLPATTSLHEDTDAETLIHSLIAYDYNYEHEDNYTCAISNVSPWENNLFELRNLGTQYEYNSFFLYKLACQTPSCGYKYGNFSDLPYQCLTDIGCMTYTRRAQYLIDITCNDAYGSTDTETLTFNVIANSVPEWRNLPNSITLDTDAVGALDTIFSITYWDLENENLIYEYTYNPIDYGYFVGSPLGNYYNSLANVTMTIHLWNKTNETLWVYINAHERRNEIEANLTIYFREYCGETATCNEYTATLNTEFNIGSQVTTIPSLLNPLSTGSHGTLTYSVVSNPSGYFTVNTLGSITTTKNLVAGTDQSNVMYYISVFVFDTNACGYTICKISLTVTSVNYDLTITNLPATVSIHEDTTAQTTLFQVTTSDDNIDDIANCSITTTSPSSSAFQLTETISGSHQYLVISRQNPNFTSAVTQYAVTVNCHDNHGSSDSKVLTVDITLNEAPSFVNLASPTAVNIDPATQTSGQVVYTVSGTDTENNVLTFSCTVENTYVPFQCEQGSNVVYVKLRRTVDKIRENNAVYSVTITISDAKHTNAETGTLTATFTSSRTHPEISNLPSTQSIDENVAVSTSVFTVSYSDPDIAEIHTFTLVSVSPTSGRYLFALDRSSGLVTTAGTFNYESVTSYILTFSVADTHLAGLERKELTVNINNVNEGPTLTVLNASISFSEDLTVSGQLPDPVFKCTDPDASEILSYTLSGSNAAYFSININTGVISLAQVWDLESGLAQSTNLVVTCTDAGGLSSTAAISLSISYVNEFTPSVTVTYPNGYPIIISSATTVITDLLYLWVVDDDAGPVTTFTYSILGDGNGYKYFTVYDNTAITGYSAALRIKNTINQYFDRNFTIAVKVSDGTNTFKVPVDVFYNGSRTVGIQEPETKCLTCTTNGQVLVAVVCIECVLIGGLVLHVVVHAVKVLAQKRAVQQRRDIQDRVGNRRFRIGGPSLVEIKPVPPIPPLPSNKVSPSKPSTESVLKRTSVNNVSLHDEDGSSISMSGSDSDDSEDSLYARRVRNFPTTRHAPYFGYTASTGLPAPISAGAVPAFTGLPPGISASSVKQ